jgi:hypothetical protein
VLAASNRHSCESDRVRRRFILACCLSTALAVAGCGTSTATSARRTATRYLADLQAGDAAAACALETPPTVRLQENTGRLFSRYDQAVPFPCAPERLAPGSFPTRALSADRTVVRGRLATVSFPTSVFLPTGDPLHLVDSSGHWHVDDTSAFSSLQTAQDAEHATQTFSPSCLSAWNEAVSSGEVTVAGLPGAGSQSSWAELTGTGGTMPCTSMEIDKPGSGYCESYVQSQADGSWLQEPCVEAPAGGQLGRDVWLTDSGTAVPASQQSPDGTVPALATLQDAASASSSSTSSTTRASEPSTTSSSTTEANCPRGEYSYGTDKCYGPEKPNQTSTNTSAAATASCGTVSAPAKAPAPTSTRPGYRDTRQTVQVSAGGPSCAVAVKVISDFLAGRGSYHQGPDLSSTYTTVDGWSCQFNMGNSGCTLNGARIDGQRSS